MQQAAPDDPSPIEAQRKASDQSPAGTGAVKIRLETPHAGGDLARIVVMNNHRTAAHEAFHEYHYGNPEISIEGVLSFTLCSSPFPTGTQAEIDDFVGLMALYRETPQVPGLCRGVYLPGAERRRLYKAIDPDDDTRLIGLLLEQDARGRLAQVTWYKTKDTRVIFQTTPLSLDFRLVKDHRGAPSADPNDIGGWTWYYCSSVGGCPP